MMHSLPLPQVYSLMQRLSPKYQALVAIGVTTGCRISEILTLRRFDLLTRDGLLKDHIAFLKLKTKSNRITHRKLAIPDTFKPYIITHLRAEEQRGYDRPDDFVFRGKLGHHMSRLTVYAVFRSLLGEGYGTHWMRKTFAQLIFRHFLDQNNSDPMRALEITRRALGHARLDTTVKYLGIMESSIESAQNAIFNNRSTP